MSSGHVGNRTLNVTVVTRLLYNPTACLLPSGRLRMYLERDAFSALFSKGKRTFQSPEVSRDSKGTCQL